MKPERLIITLLLLVSAMSMAAKTDVVAHRGYWKIPGSAQNSIASLIKADSIKVCATEFDVWLTADDSLVVNHDAVFKNVDIEHSDYAAIRSIRLDNGEVLPSLSEFLYEATKHPDIKLVLELKSLSSPERENYAAKQVVCMLKDRNLLDRTVFISFSLNACKAFKNLLPNSEIYYLEGDLTPLEIKELGFAGIDYKGKVLLEHPEWVKECHDLGLKVNVWTIDKVEQINYFKEQGVDYITTNQPVEALEIVRID